MSQFQRGGVVLFDLEYLRNNNGKRITSFSHWVGVAGCAVTLLIWIKKEILKETKLEIPHFYVDASEALSNIKQQLKNKNNPTCLVMGSRG